MTQLQSEHLSRQLNGWLVECDFKGDREQLERAVDAWLVKVVEAHRVWQAEEAARSPLRRLVDWVAVHVYPRRRRIFTMPHLVLQSGYRMLVFDNFAVHRTADQQPDHLD